MYETNNKKINNKMKYLVISDTEKSVICDVIK